MPPLPVVPNVVRFDTQWQYGSDINAHTHIYFHYTAAPPTSTQLSALAAAINGGFMGPMRTWIHSSVSLVQTTVYDLSTYSTAPGTSSSGLAGTDSGTNLPAETALLWNLHISRRYKGGHPRVYWPFFSSLDINTPQSWKAASLSGATTAMASVLNTVLSVSGLPPTLDSLCSVSYHSGHALRPTPLVDLAPTATFNTMPASQRRRMGR